MIAPDVVTAVRELANRGWGKRSIARQLGIARNTVRRYLQQAIVAGVQTRPAARRLSDAQRAQARELFKGRAGRNAAMAHRLLADRGVEISVRTVQRAVADLRCGPRAGGSLVRDHIDVVIDAQTVRVFYGTTLLATHTHSFKPLPRVVERKYSNLVRESVVAEIVPAEPIAPTASTALPSKPSAPRASRARRRAYAR